MKQPEVLVADDDPQVLEAMAALLRSRNIQVHVASDAQAAKCVAQEQELDLLIADIHMPGNSHLELLAWEPVRSCQIPLILMTGAPSVATAVTALRAGVVDYIVKPITASTVLGSVERALAQSSVGRAMQQSTQAANLVNMLLQLPIATNGSAERPANPELPGLTASEVHELSVREQEVILAMIECASVAEAGKRLHIAINTMRNHLRSVFRKLKVSSQLELVRKVMGLGRD